MTRWWRDLIAIALAGVSIMTAFAVGIGGVGLTLSIFHMPWGWLGLALGVFTLASTGAGFAVLLWLPWSRM